MRAATASGGWSKVFVMPNDLPIKQHILHSRTAPNIVANHVPSAASFSIHNNTDVCNPSAEVPGNDIAR